MTVGSGWALALDALAWLISAALLVPVRIPPREPSGRSTSTARELAEGWRFFIGTDWLRATVMAFGLLNAIISGAWLTLGPSVAQETVGRQAWGYILSAEAAGLFLTALTMLRVRLQRPLLFGMLGIIPLALPMLLLGVAPHAGLLIAANFVSGVGLEVFSLGWNLAMQEHIEESMLSRAYSYDAVGSFVAMPVGQLAYGPLSTVFGAEPVLIASSAATLTVVGLTLLSPSVRGLQRRPEGPGSPLESES